MKPTTLGFLTCAAALAALAVGLGAAATSQAAKADAHPRMARVFAMIDADDDGLIDHGEVEALIAKRFQRIDRNGDGVISVEEMDFAWTRRGAHGERRAGMLIERLDADGSGDLSAAEYAALGQRLNRLGRGPAPVFADLDLNRDGALSLAELAQAPTPGALKPGAGKADGNGSDGNGSDGDKADGVRRGPDPAKRFARADRNGDGVLSLVEFTEYGPGARLSKMFAKADADGDGAISRHEAQVAMARVRQAHAGEGGKRFGHGAMGRPGPAPALDETGSAGDD